ncbi:MAG: cupin [Peptococcaceae bacterium]|nr:cupin [Peptococcaceae bacterium]
MSIFKEFEEGKLYLSSGLTGTEEQPVDAKSIAWSPHAKFDGVELKHLITAKDTEGVFSYHLVRIAPQKKIGLHIHNTQLETHEVITGSGLCKKADQEIIYKAGTLSVLPAGIEHEVTAGPDGLSLFAKFIPALC